MLFSPGTKVSKVKFSFNWGCFLWEFSVGPDFFSTWWTISGSVVVGFVSSSGKGSFLGTETVCLFFTMWVIEICCPVNSFILSSSLWTYFFEFIWIHINSEETETVIWESVSST